MNSSIKILANVQNQIQFDINLKGLQKIENQTFITIYTDIFRSVPLYVSKDNFGLVVFSDFIDFQNIIEPNKNIDEVGFWETLLYGTPLWTRTIFKNIQQIPGASKITITKSTLEYKIEKYWNYDVKENHDIKTLREAAEGLNSHLNRIFDRIDVNKTYYMGLSGGLDSRLSLSYLSKRISRKNINLFTFGFNSDILEYQYAKNVANAFGYENVMFHKIDASTYRDALTFMPQRSLGQLSISHTHILSFFRKLNLKDALQISNYNSDALFGFATKLPKLISDDYKETNYFKRLKSYQFIGQGITDAILEDLYKITEGYENSFNYSSIDEYIYATERHSKFHMHLAWLQSRFIETLNPYADLELLKYMISVPLKYREQKVILDEVFKIFFSEFDLAQTPQISSRFSRRFSTTEDWAQFKFINVANAILRKVTDGRMQIFNKFQTEEHERLLFRDFKKDLKMATQGFMELGILNSNSKKFFDKIPMRAIDADMRYSLISLNSLLEF